MKDIRSPPQRINVNIVIPGCVMPQPILRARTPTSQRPFSPLPYSPPYCPFSTPSPSVSRTATPSHPSTSCTPNANVSAVSVVKNTPCSTLNMDPQGEGLSSMGAGATSNVTDTAPKQNLELHIGALQNDLGMVKQWQKVQCELPKVIMNFSDAIINSVSSYNQLMDFVVKCDIPTNWVERAKEDNPHNLEMVITKVFFEWWGRCNLNVGKKLQMIQAAFAYMGKP